MRISFTKQKIYLPERDEIVQKEKKLRFWAADRTVDFWKSILSFCNFFDFHYILDNEYFLEIPTDCLKKS